MGSLVGLSERVNPPSSMVPLEPPRLTSGKPDLIFPMCVSWAPGWREWLGGFVQEVPYFLHHIIQILAHQLIMQRCIRAPHKSGMEEWDLHHPRLLTSKHFAWLWFGKTFQNLVSHPSFFVHTAL